MLFFNIGNIRSYFKMYLNVLFQKEAGDLLNNISVLSVRCGLLKSIRSGDFQSFRQQIRIIDFSNNRIRHIAQDSLQGLVGLRVIGMEIIFIYLIKENFVVQRCTKNFHVVLYSSPELPRYFFSIRIY